MTAAVRAEPAGPARATPAARTEVVLGTLGLEDGPARASLVALLAAELERAGLSLVETEPREPLSAWTAAAAKPERVLAVLLLDGRGDEGWRLVAIDAARGRAIARDLPGGIHHDAASVEAVTSIAVSAALALREGLEIAFAPLSAVVGAPTLPETPPVQPETRRPASPPAAPRFAWSPRASLAGNAASFSPAAPMTAGLSLTLGMRFRELVEARLVGALFLPATVRGPLGEFRVARGWLGATAGPVLGARSFSFTPEAGIMAERLRRFEEAPAEGVLTTEAEALYRLGGVLSLRLRYRLLRSVSAELVTGAVYFGRPVQFSARSAERAWSVDAWRALAFAQLGLELALD